ncbi:Uncharacterised protein [uncultured archaeon]|nr:Uncharacterised protein [uncultured archaeon]
MNAAEITWDVIKSWTGAEMKRQMAVPENREAISKAILSRPFAEVQALAVEQEKTAEEPVVEPVIEPTAEELAAKAEADRLAAEAVAAETLRASAEAAAAERAKKKIVVEYQATDEKGNPIGRPTHLEAYSQEEIIDKMKEAHIQATRAFHRLKAQKVQSVKEVNVAPAPVPGQVSDAELLALVKDLKSDDPNVALAAYKKMDAAKEAKVRAEYEAKNAEQKEYDRQNKVSQDFLGAHQHDFNNCQANVLLMAQYIQDNQLAWTTDNLEIALHALEHELAPVAAPVVTTPPANPAPAPAPVATIAAAPVVQPAPTVTAPAAPPANPAPAQPRPGVNGGLVPGASSASRPAPTKKGLTIEEILSWDGKTMREKMRSPLRDEIVRVTTEANLRRGR